MVEIILQTIRFFTQSIFFVLIISLINSYTESIICYNLGHNFRLMFSVIGTPIHELSHALMCIIFGHKIIDMKLLILNPDSNIAGYVNHQYNTKSLYQKAGNFFIGIAPILVGFIIISTLYINFMNTPKSLSFWIALLICQQIIIHMRCSKADMQNSLHGFLVLSIVIVLFAILKINLLTQLNDFILKSGMMIVLISGINLLFFSIIHKR